MRRAYSLALAAGGVLGVVRLIANGSVTVDVGVGRSVRPLGPVSFAIAAAPEIVFDVISEPYLGKTPRAMRSKLEVWERTGDMVLAAHHTAVHGRVTTTLETVRFARPGRVDFRLVRGPVPHVEESFQIEPSADGGATLTWSGELGTDFWAPGRWWGDKVAAAWEGAVRASMASVTTEAERRSHR